MCVAKPPHSLALCSPLHQLVGGLDWLVTWRTWCVLLPLLLCLVRCFSLCDLRYKYRVRSSDGVLTIAPAVILRCAMQNVKQVNHSLFLECLFWECPFPCFLSLASTKIIKNNLTLFKIFFCCFLVPRSLFPWCDVLYFSTWKPVLETSVFSNLGWSACTNHALFNCVSLEIRS